MLESILTKAPKLDCGAIFVWSSAQRTFTAPLPGPRKRAEERNFIRRHADEYAQIRNDHKGEENI